MCSFMCLQGTSAFENELITGWLHALQVSVLKYMREIQFCLGHLVASYWAEPPFIRSFIYSFIYVYIIVFLYLYLF